MNEDQIAQLYKHFEAALSKTQLAKLIVRGKVIYQIGKKNDLLPVIKATNNSEYQYKWFVKYINGYIQKPSTSQKSSATKIKTDAILPYILTIGYKMTDKSVGLAISSHEVLMKIENIVGKLLEEYLAEKLSSKKIYCAWGSTLKHVDFCGINNGVSILLQVKNSDNSENSSSSKIRQGLSIMKWHRRISSEYDVYNWQSLNDLFGLAEKNATSESDFRDFIKKSIKQNSNILPVLQQPPPQKFTKKGKSGTGFAL